ncbi:MAG: methyltransferase domain-containing protein [Chloroflexi bacterium]|nr:methyltransferase domain-containing protein [Chloroflexota bacterium]
MSAHAQCIPALRFGWLTNLYDPLIRWTTRELAIKGRLLEQAGIRGGHRVLDVGCGTATLALLAKRRCPSATVVGLDGDARILALARAKIAQSAGGVVLTQALSYELPYAAVSFDRVLSSLVFHHLTRESKGKTLHEIFRVLRPGGELHVADWGRAQNVPMRLAFLAIQLLDGFEPTADNVRGLLPAMMAEAGFAQVEETARYATIVGTLCLYRARKPG